MNRVEGEGGNDISKGERESKEHVKTKTSEQELSRKMLRPRHSSEIRQKGFKIKTGNSINGTMNSSHELEKKVTKHDNKGTKKLHNHPTYIRLTILIAKINNGQVTIHQKHFHLPVSAAQTWPSPSSDPIKTNLPQGDREPRIRWEKLTDPG